MKWLGNKPDYVTLDEDLFAILIERDRYLVYAPVRRALFEANWSGIRQIREALSGKKRGELEIVQSFLSREGFLTALQYPKVDIERPFSPGNLILSLTSACNLACIYCYAFGGEKPLNMSWGIVKAAIDFVSNEVVKVGRTDFKITFHGGGEPMVLWTRLKMATEYAEQVARDKTLRLTVNMVTNGTVFDEEKIRWISVHISHMTLSCDGLRETQEYQRPRRDGKSSFDSVVYGMSLLKKMSVSFSMRSTITGFNITQMAEIAGFASGMGAKGLQVEPFEVAGRAKETAIPLVDPKLFVREYIRANEKAQSLGIELSYSGDKFDLLRGVFCGADGEIFCVLPTGHVSACTRVIRLDDDNANVFIYGCYDSSDNNFVIDYERLKCLRRLGVLQSSQCQDCFCKWHCAGACPNTRLTSDGWVDEGFTCYIVKELTKHRLMQALEKEEQ